MMNDENSVQHRLKSIVGGSIGNLVEWYDWYTYSAFALYFSASFFPSVDPTVQLLDSAAVFAGGFLMRPIGGWLFGSIADRLGRKKSMTISVLLMAIGSLMIAFCPAYDQIGKLAPIVLIVARLLQGISVGGEYGTSATYLSEMATVDKRGFFASFQYVTLVGGQLIALGVQLVLQHCMRADALHDYGWRIPFVLGAVLSFVALYLREHIAETNAYEQNAEIAKKTRPIKELLRYPKEILTVVGLTLGGTIAFYTYSIYMQKFLVNTVHLSKNKSTELTFISLLIFALIQPLYGMLSDKVGRKPLLIAFGVLGTICTVPLMTAISHQTDVNTILLLMMCGLLIVSGYTSINAVVKAELFPANVRALGVGLPYALTTAIFGGTAEMLGLWFKKIGHENYFYWYVTFAIFISLIIYVTMKDSKHHSKMDGLQ
ncbi:MULTISPECIES: MFS transporter [Chitinophagaceae]